MNIQQQTAAGSAIRISAVAVLRRLRAAVLVGAIPLLLSSCGDGNCYSCGAFYSPPPPAQAEFGLVAGNFRNIAGLNDVVAANTLVYSTPSASGSLEVYLENPGGTNGYAAPFSYADGTNPLFLAMGDLNNDGFADIVSASFDDGALSVFFNNPGQPGTFSAPLVLQSPGASQVAVGDVNGDGLPDLVSADYGVSLFTQSAADPGTFQAPIGLYTGGANWVAIGNLHSNVAGGPADVVVTDDVGVKVLFNTLAAGGTTFAAPVSVFTQTVNDFVAGANVVAIVDVNGDGYADLIITDPGPTGGNSPTVSVMLQDAANPGTFLAPVSYALPPLDLGQSIVVTPLTTDGLPDIVVGGTSAVSVLLNNPAQPGTFAPAVNYAVTQGASQIAVADVTGGALPDIVVTNGVTNPIVDGVFTTHPGVLQQVAGSPGSYMPLQDLP